ncbi:hypothetical protein FNO01nite_13280 [Flavobacterium noncentrifugens]|nr:hypothetical protein FNO01nite_13280 [Flavobacterium noncentrifugens]
MPANKITKTKIDFFIIVFVGIELLDKSTFAILLLKFIVTELLNFEDELCFKSKV